MTEEHWGLLLKCAMMETTPAPVAGLIVDSPWIPGYLGVDTIDYMTDMEVWKRAQLAIREHFPGVIFIPDYWVEFGMAAEPSGFGCTVSFYRDRPPAIRHRIASFDDMDQLDALPQPNPKTDGLMALALNNYRRASLWAKERGSPIKIIASRGPLNIAVHIMGVTEFLLAAKLDPDGAHRLLKRTALLTKSWLEAQAEAVGTAEGVLLLDDIAGFFSEEDYLEFAHPYLKEVLDAFNFPVKILHNDTHNPASYPHLHELGVNICNFTHEISLNEARAAVGDKVCLMGNAPPLAELAQGTPQSVKADLTRRLRAFGTCRKGLIISAGGGVSPGTPREKIEALILGANQTERAFAAASAN